MTGEEQKNTIAAFSEYLKKEDVCFFILAYKPEGDLTITINAGEELPNALACALNDDENGLEEAFGRALVLNAQAKGRLIILNNNDFNEN